VEEFVLVEVDRARQALEKNRWMAGPLLRQGFGKL
jgi:hypothetical protein